MESVSDFMTFVLPSIIFIALTALLWHLIKKMFNEMHSKIDQTIEEGKDSQGLVMLQNQLTELSKSNQELKLANEQLRSDLSEKLGQGHRDMTDSVQKQFAQSQQLIRDITTELGEVRKTGEQVVGFTQQLKSLQDILQNSQQRGALGEYFLETTIQNILPPEHYQFQYSFSDGLVADAVIKLEGGKLLAIDSKFSLENYNQIMNTEDPQAKAGHEQQFKQDLKKRIAETAKYIKPSEGTMDFAFMFIPSEAIYYDLLVSRVGVVDSKNFLEHAFRDKRVIVVSPSTLYAYLQTIMQGLKALQIEKQATTIIKKVEDLSKHMGAYRTYHEKLGNSLGTVVNHYNQSSKEYGKIDKDIIKITGSGEHEAIEQLEKPKVGEH